MSRLATTLLTALALTSVVACSDITNPSGNSVAAVARMSGGSGGGGGSTTGGGGGGGGSVRPCAITSFSIVNNGSLSSSVAPYWVANSAYIAQAIGTTEKSCDAIPTAVMRFTDETGSDASCSPVINNFIGSTYLKYGTKPMSRYDQFFAYSTGDSCVGSSRIIRATLFDSATGATISSMTYNWIVG